MHFGLVTDARLIPDPDAVVRRFGAEFEKLLYLSLMGGWEHPLDADGAAALLEEPTLAERRAASFTCRLRSAA